MYKLEIIATTPRDIMIAQQYGADRIELVSGLSEGGLTPSIGLLKQAKKIAEIPIMVMIRPRGGNFCYDEAELEIMIKDIEVVIQIGLDGIVIGILDQYQDLNFAVLQRLVRLAEGMDITLHRAFDASKDVFKSVEVIKKLDIKRVLTSGQRGNSFLGINTLIKLQEQNLSDVIFMPGVGLDPSNLARFLKETPYTKEVHLGLGVRSNKDPLSPVVGELVKDTRKVLDDICKSGVIN